MINKCILLIVFSVLSILPCQSQSSLVYEYDFAGNRVARKVITLPSNIRRYNPSDSIVVKEVFEEKNILVYPNPTKGALGVEITGGDWGEDIRLILYSGQGVLLYQANAQPGINSIDMTTFPRGWYVLRVQTGEKRKEYKILKE
jgi:hypothetical protein